MVSLWLPWAVHISDGVLKNPWLAGGFALAGLLALLASYRVRDEEIPRIALLSAAFFVASLMHLPLGPTSVHLLLNGLVGVVLGRRAPLAILIGVALQAVILGHGGFSTIGVNACVQMVPALLAAGMFAVLCRLPGTKQHRGAFLWIMGCLIGATSVLAALLLAAVALLYGGEQEDWRRIVWLLFYAHLPIVAVEGVVLGFTVSFLARVKPEMLGIADRGSWIVNRESKKQDLRSTIFVILILLLAASPARAHRLDAAYKVLPDQQVRIESWFDLGGNPKGATVQVFRPGQRLLVEGQLDEDGCFVFHYAEIEPLEVIVSAGAGHRKEFTIPAERLGPRDDPSPSSASAPSPKTPETFRAADAGDAWRERIKDVLIGIGFTLAVAAFLLSWRNARKLRSLERRNEH